MGEKPRLMISHESDVMKNKTETSEVGAISKAQKCKKIFKKNLKIFDFFLSENVA